MLALWLPHLPTDRVWREAARHAPSGGSRAHALALSPPLVLFDEARGGLRLAAVDRPAAALGLAPGLPLADARARVPELTALAADRVADGNLLARLARWATRYTPHAATDGEDGLMLDITGAAHLLGGEAALRRDLLARLARLGFAARAAIADTPGAAWALARFAPREAGRAIAGAGRGATQAALADLPAAALRLGPATLDTLARLGVRRVADLARLPRHGLAARFADEVGARLDQAFGARPEPISPLRPAETWTATLAFAEPIATAEAIAHALDRLLAQLCARLSLAASGARRLDFACRRVDGTTTGCAIATSAPTRDPQRLARLFAERLETIAPGFGIESATLRARVVETLAPSQIALASGMPREGTDASETGDLAALVDRLANRLGPEAVTRLDLTTRHAPEAAQRASRDVAAATTREPPRAWRSPWTQAPTRPLRLLPAPEPIEVTAALPDGPPLVFRWRRARHRVRRAEGPERLAAEWWLVYEHRRAVAAGDAASGPPPVAATRDYYRVEIEDGRRFWLFRLGLWSAGDAAPRWFVHGVFA